jgi:hypothetical protein
VLRHGLAALVMLAMLTPLFPVAGEAMACCRGTGESCVCPLTPGFARCDVLPLASPTRTLPAILPQAAPSLWISASFEEALPAFEALASLALPPLVPPPRY